MRNTSPEITLKLRVNLRRHAPGTIFKEIVPGCQGRRTSFDLVKEDIYTEGTIRPFTDDQTRTKRPLRTEDITHKPYSFRKSKYYALQNVCIFRRMRDSNSGYTEMYLQCAVTRSGIKSTDSNA